MNDPAAITPTPSTLLNTLGRIGRFLVFVCSSGWLFPHACTEGMDLTKLQNDQMAKQD